MSGMVKLLLSNSVLQEENFSLRVSNAYIMSENASLKTEIAALKERKHAMHEPSSHPTLATNEPLQDEKLSNFVAMSFEHQPSEAPKLPETQPLLQPFPIAPETAPDMDDEETYILNALIDAARDGNTRELGRLLSSDKGKACINDNPGNGLTPLYWAANMSRFDAVKLLVENGADVDPPSQYGGTPLTRAAQYGYEGICQYLLNKGASKEKAIETAGESAKALVKGFFAELERVIQNKGEFWEKHEKLKNQVRRSEKPETLPTTCKGITIEGLKQMKAMIQSECEAGRFREDKSFPDGTHCKGTMLFEELTTTDIVYRFVKDESVTDNLRLIDKPGVVAPEHKALPTFFISHAWKGRFSVLLDKIFAYVERHGLCDETAVWIDVFSVNQHGSKECSEFSQEQNQADVSAFKDVVQTCIDGTLVVCDFEKCVTYTRAWCLYEWDWTIFNHGREKLQFLGLSKEEAGAGQDKIDVAEAECFKAEDKEMILKEIVDKHGSTKIFNEKLQNKWYDIQIGLI